MVKLILTYTIIFHTMYAKHLVYTYQIVHYHYQCTFSLLPTIYQMMIRIKRSFYRVRKKKTSFNNSSKNMMNVL